MPNLHSRYNPEAEAERYIGSLNLSENTDCFILIEPGAGYMIPVLKNKFPESRIIALHVNDPEPEKTLEKELASCKKAHFVFKIIEWRPSMNYYKEDYVNLLSLAVKYIKKFDAEKRTVSAFGKVWVKNFFKNLENVKTALLYKETQMPVIITGSGPSLEQALPVIKELENSCLIIASSSSVLALTHYGVKPDLVIATDGGSWALKHLIAGKREQGTGNRLAVNLCAALPSQCYDTPQLILNDGSLWQNTVLRELHLPSVLIPQRGTVTASAVDLALQLTSGNIYLAGVDLAVNDIRTHVKPYAFNALLYEKANRFSPVYSQFYYRSCLAKEGGSMDIYADWFRKQFEIWPNRIFNIKEKREGRKEKKEDCFKTVPVKTKKEGIEILLCAFKGGYAEKIKEELIPLLGEDYENLISSLRSRRFFAFAGKDLQ